MELRNKLFFIDFQWVVSSST